MGSVQGRRWLIGALAAVFLLQFGVTMARPVSTYRLLALEADGTALGIATACYAIPPILLAVGFGRWTERHHPAILLCSGVVTTTLATFALVAAESVGSVAGATTVLGLGHMMGVIGAQSLIAKADSRVRRLSRIGALTTTSAFGQVLGPVAGGLLIGRGSDPTLDTTSSALLAAAWLVLAASPFATAALATRIKSTTVRTHRAEPVLSLLRRPGMPIALTTSFSAKSGVDLLLVYMPVLGVAAGLSSSQVGVLLGLSSGGALLGRAGTASLVRRYGTVPLTATATIVASLCLVVVAATGPFAVLCAAMAVLGCALGLSQTTTMDWVVDLVDHQSRGSALGLRVATNRVGQALVLAGTGALSGALGVATAFVLIAGMMLATAAFSMFGRHRGDQSR